MFIYDGLPQTNEAARRLVNARSAKMASRAKATFIRCRKCQLTRTPYRIRPHVLRMGEAGMEIILGSHYHSNQNVR
jgi:hypothetical protein